MIKVCAISDMHGILDFDIKECDILCICGDIVPLKVQYYLEGTLKWLSKEFIPWCEKQPCDKVFLIAGNHDLIVENKSRTDAITAIFDTAEFENCTFLDAEFGYKSGCAIDGNVVWCLYSIYEDFNRPTNIDEIKKNSPNLKFVGLFHGQIIGSTLNNGYVSDSGLDGAEFEGCDCVMAGHLHKRQVIKRGDCIIVYPGSLIQQTYGETISQHGFAVWNMEDMSYEFIDIDSDYGLYDVEIDDISDIDEDKERLINF
jgi:predicted phosphodiesterase